MKKTSLKGLEALTVIALSCHYLTSSANTVALWPIEWDEANQVRDGRCAIDSANDLSFDGDLVCEYLSNADWGWSQPPNPDATEGKLFTPTNGYALYSYGTSAAKNYAYSTTVGHYLTADKDYTLEGWFRFPTLPANNTTFFIADCDGLNNATGNQRWFLTFRNVNGGYNWQIFNAALNTGDVVLYNLSPGEANAIKTGWHHWAVTFNHRDESGKAVFKLYQDGVLLAVRQWNAYAGTVNCTGYFGLGGRNNAGNVFTGYIDYCRLSDTVLEPDQFMNAGDSPAPGPDDPGPDDSGQGESELPANAECDYLLSAVETTGTEYINTGVEPGSGTRVEMMYAFTDNTTLGGDPFGCKISGYPTFLLTRLQPADAPTGKCCMRFMSNDDDQVKVMTPFADPDTDDHTVSMSGAGFLLDGESVGTASAPTRLCGGKLFLFARNYKAGDGVPQSGCFSKMRLYWCKIYDGTILVRDFLPAVKGTQVGLWDRKNNKWYAAKNASGQSVSLIPVGEPLISMVPCEWIESDGIGRIVPEYVPHPGTDRMELEFDLSPEKAADVSCIWCARYEAAQNTWTCNFFPTTGSRQLGDYFRFDSLTSYGDNSGETGLVFHDAGGTHFVLSVSNNVCTINGTAYVSAGAWTGAYPVCNGDELLRLSLFTGYRTTIDDTSRHSDRSVVKLYSCRIYRRECGREELIHDLRPMKCTGVKAKCCFLDVVRGRKYTPVIQTTDATYTAGQFTVGPAVVSDKPICAVRRLSCEENAATFEVRVLLAGGEDEAADLYFARTRQGGRSSACEKIATGVKTGETFTYRVEGLDKGAQYGWSCIASNSVAGCEAITGTFATLGREGLWCAVYSGSAVLDGDPATDGDRVKVSGALIACCDTGKDLDYVEDNGTVWRCENGKTYAYKGFMRFVKGRTYTLAMEGRNNIHLRIGEGDGWTLSRASGDAVAIKYATFTPSVTGLQPIEIRIGSVGQAVTGEDFRYARGALLWSTKETTYTKANSGNWNQFRNTADNTFLFREPKRGLAVQIR